MTGNPRIMCLYAADFLPSVPSTSFNGTEIGFSYGIFPRGDIDIERIMKWVATYSLSVGGLEKLYIVCHAQGANLQIGYPGISLANVETIGRILKGKVKVIDLYCCDLGNSPSFCRKLAAASKATVIAYPAKVLAWTVLYSYYTGLYF
ncbi:hypothetical protein [Runella sp.]|jgi:hypothetical protein|uniref:hypothetical protein n=1 Tax=Runella sp. TaxID=1960881 RepID=UPI002626225E|nr:hypothetical protein [Runella sp.]